MVDIIKYPEFMEANLDFRSAMADMKRRGYGDTKHYPVITDGDRRVLYHSPYLTTETPAGLQNKVQFDIRLHFCRRGSENMHDLQIDTFEIKTDQKTGYNTVYSY
jgi:hypothetical protein